MKPSKCPVCQGSGSIHPGVYALPTEDGDITTCRSCGGTGIVWPPQEALTFSLDLSSEMEWDSHTYVPLSTMDTRVSAYEVATFDYVVKVEDCDDFTAKFTETTINLNPTSQVEMQLLDRYIELVNSRAAMQDRDRSMWPDKLEQVREEWQERIQGKVLPFLPPEPSE